MDGSGDMSPAYYAIPPSDNWFEVNLPTPDRKHTTDAGGILVKVVCL